MGDEQGFPPSYCLDIESNDSKALMESGEPVIASGSSTSTATAVASPMIEAQHISGALEQFRESRRGDGPVTGRVFMCPELYKAATSGKTDHLLELLHPATNKDAIHCPCSLSEVTVGRNTVLHLAAGLGLKELAEEAYSRERSLLTEENSWGDTPLHCAARAGCDSVVSLLLQKAQEYGVRAEEVLMKTNRLGDTALHEAVRRGNGEVSEVLLTKTPDLASMDNKAGVSPLYLAVMRGSIRLVERLIRCDNASFAGPKGQTALHAAVLSSKKITSLLLGWKPKIAEQVDASLSTPLHYAASGADKEILQMLLNASTAATYSRDMDGFSPIHVAARVGNLMAIKLILKTGPDSAEILDDKGRNFLHLAAERNKVKVVQYVLKHGNELEELFNKQDLKGNTPLHLAVESENSLVAFELADDRRIEKSIMNDQGHTPLELASKIKRLLPLVAIVKMLTSSGASFSVRRQDQVEPWNSVDSTWYDKVSENLALVSGLIATVSFSATFNLPGGYDSTTGKATLYGKARFNFFMAFDSIAMISSLSSILLLLLARLGADRDRWLFITGILTFWLAIFFMFMAFMVAAISAGVGRGIIYAAYIIYVAPRIFVLFFDPSSMILISQTRKRLRAKLQLLIERISPVASMVHKILQALGKTMCLGKRHTKSYSKVAPINCLSMPPFC